MKHAYKIKSHTFLRTFRVQTNGQMAFQKIPRHISVLLGFLFVKTIQGCRVSRQPDRKRITRKNMLSVIQSYIIYNLQLLAGKWSQHFAHVNLSPQLLTDLTAW